MTLGRRGLLAGASLLASMAAWAPAWGQVMAAPTAAADGSLKEEADSSLNVPPFDPAEDVDRRMQAFIGQDPWAKRIRSAEVFVGSGKGVVKVTAEPQDWVKFRAAAYAEALLNAQADLVGAQRTSIVSETLLLFQKGSDQPPDYKPPDYKPDGSAGQAAEIIGKILAVAGGRLDSELRELGVDPKRYEAAPAAQRTVMLSDSIQRTTQARSVGDTIGLCPLRTFEGYDGAGQYVVGAVVATSARMRDFVREMATARGSFEPNPALAQDLSKLYSDNEALVQEFGIRRLFDADGLPVVVSFGQWASSYRGPDTALALIHRDAARRQSELIADGQLADFVNGSLTYIRSGRVGAQASVAASAIPDGTTLQTNKEAVDSLNRSIKQTSQATIVGLRSLHSWTAIHPASKTPIVGVIRIWSAANEKATRGMMEPPRPAARAAPGRPPGTPGRSGGRDSRPLMDATDF